MSNKNNAVNFHAVVPSAGLGRRMGGDQPKQYLPLLGKTVMEITLEKLLAEPRLQSIVLATSTEDSQWRNLPVLDDQRITVIDGGKERCHSVLNGLSFLSAHYPASDWVLVHDVARPCVAQSDIAKMILQLEDDAVGGILACPVSDTIKQVNESAEVIATIDRNLLWRAQTPQMFRLGLLLKALTAAIDSQQLVTDEASAIELSGLRPRIVQGSAANIKITRAEDLALAEYYLQREALSCV